MKIVRVENGVIVEIKNAELKFDPKKRQRVVPEGWELPVTGYGIGWRRGRAPGAFLPPAPAIRCAQLDDAGTVINVTRFGDSVDIPGGWVPCSAEVGIGWNYDGIEFTPPVPPPEPEPTPEELAAAGRAWRNRELQRADIEIHRLEDTGADPSAWRGYRILLRGWPETLEFPHTRPEAPHAPD